MPYFRKKPTTVEAKQWDGTDKGAHDLRTWTANGFEFPKWGGGTNHYALLWVKESGVWCRVYPGGWIVCEPTGTGFYPITEDIFAESYELIGEVPYA